MIKLTRPPLRSGWRFLDDSDHFRHTINIASVASLRSPDRNHRNTDRLRWNPQKALRGESKLLSRGTALEMAAPTGTGPFAIGFVIEKRGEGWYLTHDGSNWGFRANLAMHRLKGYGIAVMTNSESGGQIITEIEDRVAAAANWDSLDKSVPR